VHVAEQVSALTSTRRIRARYNVTDCVDEPGDWFVSAELVLPEPMPGTESITLLCCTPGGSCTGEYFDLGGPQDGFSFANYAARAGFPCVLVDNLGTGRSAKNSDVWLSPESVARAGIEAFSAATADLRAMLAVETAIHSVAVGHSMGAMLALMGQAMTGQHDAIACLGFTSAGLPSVLTAEERGIAASGLISLDILKSFARKRFSEAAQVVADLPEPEPFPFNLPDTDPVGLAALRAAATNLLPLPAMLSLLPGNIAAYISQVAVPVFLGGGEHEPWHNASELVKTFTGSNDITFYALPAAAHNHNIASTRTMMWSRLLDWASSVGRTSPAPLRPLTSNEGALL
jgi:pimeloyl-ACP methyl ester carboxylesterase